MTTLTAPSPATPGSSSAAEDAARCGSCPHPLATHDTIGLRFCSATSAGSFTRGCVCPT